MLYYFKSFYHFLFFIAHFIAFRQSRLRLNRRKVDKNKDLILIDTFTMIDKIYPMGQFEDVYFGALYDIMKKRDKQYVILCILFGDRMRNLRRRIQTYNILSKDGRNFITEFELMGLSEWLELLKFIVICPLSTLRLTYQSYGEFDDLFRQEIIDTLDHVLFWKYVRYLTGRKLSSLTNKKLKVICWYENQVIDKLLFLGIRESGVDAKIIGCEFTDKAPLFRSLYPLLEEVNHNVLPDVRLVSGKYYLNENPIFNVKLGLSPRYEYLFNIHLDKKSILTRNGVLILLTYDINESKQIIRVTEKLDTRQFNENVTIKYHPNHLLLRRFNYPSAWKYTKIPLSKLCLVTSTVLTAASTVAIEAAIMGCSVIIIANENGLTLNPMPEYGKGKIWEIVFDSDSLAQSIDRLSQYRHKNPDKVITLSNHLRDIFFTQATEKKYIELFEL